MSTFGGRMQEYCNISIDRFDGENLQSTAFFLSHCHQDHMNGLTSKYFSELLDGSPNYHLYCSDITKVLLKTDKRYVHLEKHLVDLPVNQPATVKVPDKATGQDELITVTLIPAGHCLGSVMFLFEGDKGAVLYTGDFRLPQGGPSRIPPLMSGASPKHIKSLYIDTTFCVKNARFIASREESAEAIITLLEGWVHQSPHHMVKLITKAAYSYEHLFEVIYKKFGKKVHVTDQRHSQYQLIPGLGECTTSDGEGSQIHACGWRHESGAKSPLACGYRPPTNGEEMKLMVIQPSTMWFTQRAATGDIVKELASKFRVCYCFHPSYSEIQEFVQFLRPERVFPNVKPLGHSLFEVQKTLDMFRTSEVEAAVSMAGGDSPFTPVKKSLGILKAIKKRKISSSPGESEGLLFDDEELHVPRKRKKTNNGTSIAGEKDSEKRGSDKDSDLESYHTDSYKGSDNDDNDILGSDAEVDDGGVKKAPPGGSLLSYISDDDSSDEEMLIDENRPATPRKSRGFSQSADLFDDEPSLTSPSSLLDGSGDNGESSKSMYMERSNSYFKRQKGAEIIDLECPLDGKKEASTVLAVSDEMNNAESSKSGTMCNIPAVECLTGDEQHATDDSGHVAVPEGKSNNELGLVSERMEPKKTDSKIQKLLELNDDVDTDATTVCSQPLSQNVHSEVEELNKSGTSIRCVNTLAKRTARKSIRSPGAQATNPVVSTEPATNSGPKRVEVIDLTASDSEDSVYDDESSVGRDSEDYDGDSEFLDELDTEDEFSYYRSGGANHNEVLDSEEEEFGAFEEGEVIIVDSDSSDDIDEIDISAEARQISRLNQVQVLRSSSLEEGMSDSDVNVIHENLEDESYLEEEEDFEGNEREIVTIDDSVVNLDESVVNLDDSIFDDGVDVSGDNDDKSGSGIGANGVEEEFLTLDDSIFNLDKSISDSLEDKSTAPKASVIIESTNSPALLDLDAAANDSSVVLMDAKLGPESQDLFSSDPGDHLLNSDPEEISDPKIVSDPDLVDPDEGSKLDDLLSVEPDEHLLDLDPGESSEPKEGSKLDDFVSTDVDNEDMESKLDDHLGADVDDKGNGSKLDDLGADVEKEENGAKLDDLLGVEDDKEEEGLRVDDLLGGVDDEEKGSELGDLLDEGKDDNGSKSDGVIGAEVVDEDKLLGIEAEDHHDDGDCPDTLLDN